MNVEKVVTLAMDCLYRESEIDVTDCASLYTDSSKGERVKLTNEILCLNIQEGREEALLFLLLSNPEIVDNILSKYSVFLH